EPMLLNLGPTIQKLGEAYLAVGKHDKAETLLRESLVIRQDRQSDAWTTFNTQSMLGAALLGQKKYADAEPLLLASYDGLRDRQAKLPPQVKDLRLQEAMGRLAELFEATRDKKE